VQVPGASGSPEAAVAAAAYYMLVGLYPSQMASLQTTYNNYLASHFLVGDDGLAVGQAAATAMLPLYRAAPSPLPPPFTGGTDPGEWRPTDSLLQGSGPNAGLPGPPFGPPPPFAAMANPWQATIEPLTLKRVAPFRMGPPPRLNSDKYRREYEEVRNLGARLGSTRTAEQTDLGYFYADNFLALWYRALRGIVEQQALGLGDGARLLALATLAAADSGIVAWDNKVHYNFWRPITAIREGDHDGNRRTVGDPDWEPLINTPN
jgi:hypothetical protein